jgi:putative transposase
VTLRAVQGLPSLRLPHLFPALREAIRKAHKLRFRICHFSVQSNHVHLLVEAKDRQALSRGVQGLAIRLARAANRVLGRRGKVWADRYHRHDLATPREVRQAIVYVLQNARKHQPGFTGLDPFSSARWFTGWCHTQARAPAEGPAPVLSARTCYSVRGGAATGWWRRASGQAPLRDRLSAWQRRSSDG